MKIQLKFIINEEIVTNEQLLRHVESNADLLDNNLEITESKVISKQYTKLQIKE